MADEIKPPPQGEQSKIDVNEERERYDKALIAESTLLNEIAKLKTEDITSDNSAFIAGLYLGRKAEASYLSSFDIDANHDYEKLAKSSDPKERLASAIFGDNPGKSLREGSGELQSILADATKGDYQKLKEFTVEKSNSLQRRGLLSKSKQSKEALLWVSRTFGTIAERMPLQGPPIKMPSPAWMEEPVPLREQLRQLKRVTPK